ncbi:hypothetical protein [Silvibacterium dinghuense]|uniref:hypothetical protein n=1 Tax=Silvibacterium dinghuense TaxID=1560006 RepID=UPI0013E96F13|nr:hypothetical protein [Silvibacterium dinghuense]
MSLAIDSKNLVHTSDAGEPRLLEEIHWCTVSIKRISTACRQRVIQSLAEGSIPCVKPGQLVRSGRCVIIGPESSSDDAIRIVLASSAPCDSLPGELREGSVMNQGFLQLRLPIKEGEKIEIFICQRIYQRQRPGFRR